MTGLSPDQHITNALVLQRNQFDGDGLDRSLDEGGGVVRGIRSLVDDDVDRPPCDKASAAHTLRLGESRCIAGMSAPYRRRPFRRQR